MDRVYFPLITTVRVDDKLLFSGSGGHMHTVTCSVPDELQWDFSVFELLKPRFLLYNKQYYK